ncbi:collagenase-like PrtC family protease [Rhizobium petrolearium]|uniref:ubiquinone anaerobic biosynthesis protein UbiV n=1 Tax=Neorhizobium petrolearium TaxID=515361 RepID=UPI001AE87B12|nr:U32 family peptidase [Neorhizobium petrolearium]MBP1844198.1 collagenase-like PrtC family protease [Neorhizobium petrolearium]
MSRTVPPSLTMGPVYYLWDGPKWRDFHFRIADEAPVDRVVIGETVCSKRQHFIEPHIAEVIERLETAGKKVVLSTLSLVTLERESRQIRELIADSEHLIEANDLSALGLLNGRPHSIGPLVNVYNAATARLLADRGATAICLPPELPFTSVEKIIADDPGIAFEVFAFGRMPLAISARCAHARSKGRIKDNCQFVCGEDPDGLPVKTLDRQSFLALNGVQTVSHTCQALLGELASLSACGVSAIRLSPQDCDMVAVAKLYRAVLDDTLDADEAIALLREIYPMAPLSNGFHHAREGAAWVARARNTAHGADLS